MSDFVVSVAMEERSECVAGDDVVRAVAAHGDGSHYVSAGNTLGKSFQSDADEEICDGAQLAADVCAGLRECAWNDLFMQVSPAPCRNTCG